MSGESPSPPASCCFVCTGHEAPLYRMCKCRDLLVHAACIRKIVERVPSHAACCAVCKEPYDTRGAGCRVAFELGPCVVCMGVILCFFAVVVASTLCDIERGAACRSCMTCIGLNAIAMCIVIGFAAYAFCAMRRDAATPTSVHSTIACIAHALVPCLRIEAKRKELVLPKPEAEVDAPVPV